MAGDAYVRVVSTATHYHADYVNPRWSGHMKRLIKIGRHIFYHDS
jgi:spore germination cell wall hydrolase CwlJ-like protein